jgi:hypothetical protein
MARAVSTGHGTRASLPSLAFSFNAPEISALNSSASVGAKGPQLPAFFAKFWLVVGVLSFLLQALLGRIALEKLGLAVSVAVLPAIVVFGGALGIALPGLFSMVLLRGGEATQRNSLFRAAYELLYAPLSAQKKRASKTIIDVGCDRLGTVLAGGIAMAAVALYPAPRAGMTLLVIAMGCALVTVARSVPLHRGYVALLEENLRKAAERMTPSSGPTAARPTQEIALRDKIVEHLELVAHGVQGAAREGRRFARHRARVPRNGSSRQLRDLVWPFVGEARPMRAARPAGDILADLVRAGN